jgi:hypothetical protein
MLLRPKKWSDFQHYKNRCPPWIKLHRDLLNDKDYMRLPLASKALAPLLWLLASESKDGVFDASVDELEFRLRISSNEIKTGLKSLIDKGFFINASNVLADCLQHATPEGEGEGETEGTNVPVGKPDDQINPKAVIDLYHQTLPELPQVRILNDKRKRSIKTFCQWVLTSKRNDGQRRAETNDQAVEWIKSYFDRAKCNDFLMGREPRTNGHTGWQCDIDFLISEKGRVHVIEKTKANQ